MDLFSWLDKGSLVYTNVYICVTGWNKGLASCATRAQVFAIERTPAQLSLAQCKDFFWCSVLAILNLGNCPHWAVAHLLDQVFLDLVTYSLFNDVYWLCWPTLLRSRVMTHWTFLGRWRPQRDHLSTEA